MDQVTGLLFYEQSVAAIQQVVRDFKWIESSFDPEVIRAHAMRFSTQTFRQEFSEYVHAKWRQHERNIRFSPSPAPSPAPDERNRYEMDVLSDEEMI